MATRVQVHNVPPFLPPDDFVALFSQVDGCQTASLHKDPRTGYAAPGPRPAASLRFPRPSRPASNVLAPRRTQTGYLTFASPHQADTCMRMYDRWAGWGPTGLAFELHGVDSLKRPMPGAQHGGRGAEGPG